MRFPGHHPNKYMICVFQKYIHFHHNNSFFSFRFHFQFLHRRVVVKGWSPWDYFPACDIIHKAPYLCKMPGGLQRKKENTHTTLISSSQSSGRLLALSLALAVMPSLSPRKFQCTPLPEALIYLNRWGPGSLCFPKCCCSWTSSYRYQECAMGQEKHSSPF